MRPTEEEEQDDMSSSPSTTTHCLRWSNPSVKDNPPEWIGEAAFTANRPHRKEPHMVVA